MKCKNCSCSKKGWFRWAPNEYVCTGVKEPFVINDYENAECTEYKNPQTLKLKDGVYMELFAVKDGTRYSAKIIDMKETATILTNSLMDGVQKLWS